MFVVSLWLEYLVLFFASPLLVVFDLVPNRPIPVLIIAASVIAVLLVRDSTFERSWLWNFQAARAGFRNVFVRFLIGGGLLSLVVAILVPEKLFEFVLRAPHIWAIVLVGYPLLSVYPQELIFRSFLFHRYRTIFRNETAQIIASGLAFGFVHIVFGNWISLVLSTVGGFLFAATYIRSRSLALVCIEHSLYGLLIFTVGIGSYFYHGAR